MSIQRVFRLVVFTPLRLHDIHRIVKQRKPAIECRLRHDHGGLRLTPEKARQRTDVIQMRVAHYDGINRVRLDIVNKGKRFFSYVLWMGPRIEYDPGFTELKQVGIAANICMADQIFEKHELFTLWMRCGQQSTETSFSLEKSRHHDQFSFSTWLRERTPSAIVLIPPQVLRA